MPGWWPSTLAAAGVAANRAPVVPLAARMAGRWPLHLLTLPELACAGRRCSPGWRRRPSATTGGGPRLDRRVEAYRLQGASYALAGGRASGEPVARVTFVFLTPDGAVERHLGGLDQAMADVAALVAAGTEPVGD